MKRFPHTDQARAAAGGIKDDIGELPAALFRQLQPHRLLSLEPVRFFEGGHVEPLHRLGTFADHSAAVRDQAVDQEYPGPSETGFELVNAWRIIGHEDVDFHAGSCTVGSEGTARIAGRGDGEPI